MTYIDGADGFYWIIKDDLDSFEGNIRNVRPSARPHKEQNEGNVIFSSAGFFSVKISLINKHLLYKFYLLVRRSGYKSMQIKECKFLGFYLR